VFERLNNSLLGLNPVSTARDPAWTIQVQFLADAEIFLFISPYRSVVKPTIVPYNRYRGFFPRGRRGLDVKVASSIWSFGFQLCVSY
jgi:hypothetical protein